MTHILGYSTVLSDAIDHAVEYCRDHACEGREAPDVAYGFQYLIPGDTTGKAQREDDTLFWRMVYRRMIGYTSLPSGMTAEDISVPEMFLPTEATA